MRTLKNTQLFKLLETCHFIYWPRGGRFSYIVADNGRGSKRLRTTPLNLILKHYLERLVKQFKPSLKVHSTFVPFVRMEDINTDLRLDYSIICSCSKASCSLAILSFGGWMFVVLMDDCTFPQSASLVASGTDMTLVSPRLHLPLHCLLTSQTLENKLCLSWNQTKTQISLKCQNLSSQLPT